MMIRKIFITAIISIIFSLNLSPKNYLAVISLDIYQNRLSSSGKTAAAKEIKDYLYTNYEIDTCYELYDYDATYSKIDELLQKLNKEVGADDTLIFYFSGAGVDDEEANKQYWFPFDAGINETEKINWIPLSNISAFFKKSNSKQLLLITDTIFPKDSFNNAATAESAKDKNLKSRQAILATYGTSAGILAFLKSNKDRFLTSYSLLEGIKAKSPEAYMGNFKESGYNENSFYFLAMREKPLEKPVIVEKKEEKKEENKPEEKKIIVMDPKLKLINGTNRAGFILMPFAATFLTSGAFIFAIQMAAIDPEITRKLKDEDFTYDQYLTLYKTNLTLFITGIGLMSIGTTMFICAIPLAVYKDKTKAVTFNIRAGRELGFDFKYEF